MVEIDLKLEEGRLSWIRPAKAYKPSQLYSSDFPLGGANGLAKNQLVLRKKPQTKKKKKTRQY